MLSKVFRLIERPEGLQNRLQPGSLIAEKPRARSRRRSCSRRRSQTPTQQEGPCAVCGGIPPKSTDCPPPSCGHWELAGEGWARNWRCCVCFVCMNFQRLVQGRRRDISLPKPSCGHWSFTTVVCGCRMPDGQWHRHICMKCIDFQPVTFSGLPTKCEAPSCGHWVWHDGCWMPRGQYERRMQQKAKEENLTATQEEQDQKEEALPLCNSTSVQEFTGFFTFSQFEQAYTASE